MSLKSKFTKIGLCLPGGGFRAAGFCLGILKCLHDLDLIKNIKGISTVSGGTITGAKFAQSQMKGLSFDDFYEELHSWLKSNQLVSDAITTLKEKRVWKKKYPYKRRNLINAFAIQYQKFIPGTLGDLEDQIVAKKMSLERVIFNATDFTNGIEFRFQNLDKGHDFGNFFQDKYFKDIRSHIQIGDMVAASSCFPGGFEPLSFPGDFIDNVGVLTPEARNGQEVGLMDGGIIDNQGSSSFTTGKLTYDCYLVGDVGSETLSSPFAFSDGLPAAKWISRIFNKWILIFLVLATIISYYFALPILKEVILIITSVLIGLHILLGIAYQYARTMANLKEKVWLSPQLIGIYLMDRIRSIILMNNAVFLKGAKSRNITNLFKEAPKRVEKISIYELHRFMDKKPATSDSHWERVHRHTGDIPERLVNASKTADDFGTTLWFEDDRGTILDQLILAGKATTCFSLITFLLKHQTEACEKGDPFFEKLMALWRSF